MWMTTYTWGLNCERHYNFSLFSPHFSTSSPSFCISPTFIKAAGIYILTIFKTLFPYFSLYMSSKSWSETHRYQDCPQHLMWLGEWPQKVREGIHVYCKHSAEQPSWPKLSSLSSSEFLHFCPVYASSSLLFKEDSTICLAVLRNLPVEILNKINVLARNFMIFVDQRLEYQIKLLSEMVCFHIWFPRNQSRKTQQQSRKTQQIILLKNTVVLFLRWCTVC